MTCLPHNIGVVEFCQLGNNHTPLSQLPPKYTYYFNSSHQTQVNTPETTGTGTFVKLNIYLWYGLTNTSANSSYWQIIDQANLVAKNLFFQF